MLYMNVPVPLAYIYMDLRKVSCMVSASGHRWAQFPYLSIAFNYGTHFCPRTCILV